MNNMHGDQNSPANRYATTRRSGDVCRYCQDNRTSESSGDLNGREYREVLFWMLLLGSWQLLASSGPRTGTIGGLGAATFLVFAWVNVDKLTGLGLNHARWRSTPAADVLLAGTCGIVAGVVVFLVGTLAHQNMKLGHEWKLIALQVTLGPVLEEVVFRGYLFAFLAWCLSRMDSEEGRNRSVVGIAAIMFALVHLAQPGVSWLEIACITGTGTLYGWIRCRSGSTVAAAVSHATYNLTLYATSGVVFALRK